MCTPVDVHFNFSSFSSFRITGSIPPVDVFLCIYTLYYLLTSVYRMVSFISFIFYLRGNKTKRLVLRFNFLPLTFTLFPLLGLIDKIGLGIFYERRVTNKLSRVISRSNSKLQPRDSSTGEGGFYITTVHTLLGAWSWRNQRIPNNSSRIILP
jgi:hypothetical protein